MGSILKFLVSSSPCLALATGFLLILPELGGTTTALVQTGWGFVTVGIVLQLVLPLSRRYK